MRTAIMEKIGEVTFEMILVEGGTFLMGDDSEEAFDREQPVHEVRVPDFWFEVS